MFDPAALLIKTIGLALPVEAANGPAGQQPGEGADAAGSGGFANLLALKLESAEPAAAVPSAAQLATPPAVSPLSQPALTDAPMGWTAKALPATGNILPPALPDTLPTALPAALPTGLAPVQLPTQASAKATAQAPVPGAPHASLKTAALPTTVAPAAPRKAATPPASAETPAIPEVAPQDAGSVTPQADFRAVAPSRRAAPRVAVAVAAVLTEAGAAPEPAQQAPAPQTSMPPALPAVTAKPRPAATRNAQPDAPEPAAPEQRDPAEAEAELLPAVLVLADPMIPAPIAAAVTVQAAEPATAEFTPSPAPATSGKAPLAAAPALPAETTAPLPQTDAAPAPDMAAQIRVAMPSPAEPGRQEGATSPSAAPARRAEETTFEDVLPAASRAMAAPAALPPAAPAPTHGHVAAQAPTTVEAPADFAQIVDRLVAARDAVAPAEVRVTLDHAQFGKVSVGFTPDASGMNVTLAAADPEFARAVEAAAPFAPPAASEAPQVAASSTARGGDLPSTLTGQQGQQSGRQQPPADPRGGSAQANTSNRTPDSEARGARGRGIFA